MDTQMNSKIPLQESTGADLAGLSAIGTPARILVAEASATMRQIIQEYLEEAGYEVDSHAGYIDAASALKAQFESFDTDYACVVLGWPSARDRETDRLLGLLESVDHHDLPVIVLSQDMRPDSRAWVKARRHSVMLKWNDYRSLGTVIGQVLHDSLADTADSLQPQREFDDIRVMVVDDSTSIRYALRDLLSLHGYQVVVAGSIEEALVKVGGRPAAADTAIVEEPAEPVDIVLLDYYLHDQTSEAACRELLDVNALNPMMIAIMVGNYSEAVIRQCLQAGACDCLFKNESSELLLARVDALSRVVKQRRVIQDSLGLSTSILGAIAGCVVTFDLNGVVTWANTRALRTLGHADATTLVWRPLNEVVSADLMNAERNRRISGRFLLASGGSLDVRFKIQELGNLEGEESFVLMFRTDEEQDQLKAAQRQGHTAAHDLFVRTVTERLGSQADDDGLSTLLMIDVYYVDADKTQLPVSESPVAVNLLSDALASVYRKENHVAYLGNSRFGILLRHNTDSQAYLLTRKIMQIANDIGKQTQLGEFSCNGALLKLDANATLSAEELLVRARQGLKLVESRGRNNALLMDLKRMLPIYPKKGAEDDDSLLDED